MKANEVRERFLSYFEERGHRLDDADPELRERGHRRQALGIHQDLRVPGRESIAPLRHRARGFLGPLERGAEQGHDGPVGEIVCRGRGHRATVRGQVIARQAAVDDAARVFHLAVPEQVDDG